MFTAPGIAAYLFYQHPGWLGASTVNKGSLLTPPVILKNLDSSAKWRIVFWSPTTCTTQCFKELDTIARVRLALGRKLYDVDQWLILGNNAKPISKKQLALLAEQDFRVTQLSTDDKEMMAVLPSQARVYLADPENYLILSYGAQLNPEDIYKDLKLLLNTATKTKSG